MSRAAPSSVRFSQSRLGLPSIMGGIQNPAQISEPVRNCLGGFPCGAVGIGDTRGDLVASEANCRRFRETVRQISFENEKFVIDSPAFTQQSFPVLIRSRQDRSTARAATGRAVQTQD